jgi:DNA mismatch repair protein MutS2
MDNAQKGSPVYVKTLHKNGVIVDLDAKEVLVSVGILKMKAAYADCLLIKKGPAHVSEPTKYRKGYAHQMFQAKLEATPTEVDLRGMTTGEAIPIVDKAIDDALLAGMSQVRIIHGKGTGASKGWTYSLSQYAYSCAGTGRCSFKRRRCWSNCC